MNIKKLYYYHHKIAVLKAWYFLVPAIIFTLVAISGLRGNYSKMDDLRQAVYAADQQEGGDVEGALTELRKHVYGHMNTNLSTGSNAIKPPIQLKSRYDRLKNAETGRVAAINAQVTATAEQQSSAQFPAAGYNAPRVECIQGYVGANAAKEQVIPDQLYKFDFVSPSWSADKAGIGIVLAVIFYVLFIARLLLEYAMRRRLR